MFRNVLFHFYLVIDLDVFFMLIFLLRSGQVHYIKVIQKFSVQFH